MVGEAEGVHTRHPDTGTEGPPEWGTVAVGVDVVEVVEVVGDMVKVVVVIVLVVVEVVGVGAQWRTLVEHTVSPIVAPGYRALMEAKGKGSSRFQRSQPAFSIPCFLNCLFNFNL